MQQPSNLPNDGAAEREQRLPYETPTIEEVSLQPEEQLLACGKIPAICPAGVQLAS